MRNMQVKLFLQEFSVIDSGKNDYENTVKEALYIRFKRRTIQKQLFTQGTSFVLSIL